MNGLTPQSMRSPISPYDRQSKQSFACQNYPSSPQTDSALGPPARGLGIYDCSLPQTHAAPLVHDLPPSPQPSDGWSHSSMMEPDFGHPSQQPPDLSTAAFDPFSGYTYNGTHSTMTAAPSPEAPGLVFCQTPPSTNMPSHRDSVSSTYSDSYSHEDDDYYTPRVKAEDSRQWYPSPTNENVLQRSLTTHGLHSYSNGPSPIDGPTEDPYLSKHSAAQYPMQYGQAPRAEPRSRFEKAPVASNDNRIKKKRQRTTPEEATHECRVCGKLFKRSYNWKSHMETHNPERKYPHPCTATVGNQPCMKKFQRKTDLDRHVDSVHLKARNHRCDLCGNRFARRDTLRRHTEDGCPKRFELGFRDEDMAPTPTQWPVPETSHPASYPPAMPKTTPIAPSGRSFSVGGPLPIPSSSMPPPAMSAPIAPAPFSTYERAGFVSSPVQAASVFAA